MFAAWLAWLTSFNSTPGGLGQSYRKRLLYEFGGFNLSTGGLGHNVEVVDEQHGISFNSTPGGLGQHYRCCWNGTI